MDLGRPPGELWNGFLSKTTQRSGAQSMLRNWKKTKQSTSHQEMQREEKGGCQMPKGSGRDCKCPAHWRSICLGQGECGKVLKNTCKLSHERELSFLPAPGSQKPPAKWELLHLLTSSLPLLGPWCWVVTTRSQWENGRRFKSGFRILIIAWIWAFCFLNWDCFFMKIVLKSCLRVTRKVVDLPKFSFRDRGNYLVNEV